jgi:hypothetical protein
MLTFARAGGAYRETAATDRLSGTIADATDVQFSALQPLGMEASATRSSPLIARKSAKLFCFVSDLDAPFGARLSTAFSTHRLATSDRIFIRQ